MRTISKHNIELETDSLVEDSVTHLVTELRDNYGRSVGYAYAKNGSVQQTVSFFGEHFFCSRRVAFNIATFNLKSHTTLKIDRFKKIRHENEESLW